MQQAHAAQLRRDPARMAQIEARNKENEALFGEDKGAEEKPK
jgi:hypothetical protein